MIIPLKCIQSKLWACFGNVGRKSTVTKYLYFVTVVFILRYFPFCFIYYVHKICDMCWTSLLRCELNSVVRQCWSEWAISLIFTELQITNLEVKTHKTLSMFRLNKAELTSLTSLWSGWGRWGRWGRWGSPLLEHSRDFVLLSDRRRAPDGLFKHTLRPPQRRTVFSTCPCVFKTGRELRVVFRRQK